MKTLSRRRADHHQALSDKKLRVETVSDYGDFLRLEPAWTRLAKGAAIDHPFLTHEWMRAWWDCFGARATLGILVLKAEQDPVAIAPFMRSHDRLYGFKMRRLRFIHNDHTPICDFIVGKETKNVHRTIWSHLLRHKSDWDLIEFPDVSETSGTLQKLVDLAAADGFRVGTWPSSNAPYVSLAGSWDGYVRRLRKHHRSNINNRLNRLRKLGPTNLEVVSSKARIPKALEEGYRIEAAAWKGEAGTAIASQPAVRRFYTAFAERAAERGWLRLFFLNVNGERVAFDYCVCYQNKLYSLKIGYDPRFASYSPCNLLKYLVMRHAFELGLTESHFLGGEDKWKLEWARQTRAHRWVFIFSPDMRGSLLHWAKFRVVPNLQQHRLYRRVRKAAVAARNFLLS